MGLLTRKLFDLLHIKKNQIDKKVSFIFYKIVDFNSRDNQYKIQCISKSAIIYATITEIVFDIDILYGLHPIQACYVGLEYAKHLKKINAPSLATQQKQEKKLKKYSVHRYGNYRVCYQDRKGNISFVDEESQQEFLMDPCDIALSEELIEEFDSVQAFYIGLLAGLKLNEKKASVGTLLAFPPKSYLRLVK